MLSGWVFAAIAGSVATSGDDEGVDPAVVRIVEEARNGSVQAFADLYDLYVDRVYRYVVHRVGDRHLAEDLTADVFTRALRRMSTYTYTGKDPAAWLLTIARNRVHDHFRSGRFRLESPVEQLAELPDAGDSPEVAAERAETGAMIREALNKLRSDHAEVLYMRFLQGLSVGEVAEVMNRREGAVRALQFRALKALAKHVPEGVVP